MEAYGEVKTSWPDRKVSNALTNLLKDTGQLWDLPVKQQLWILGAENAPEIWIFDYTRGIWTKFNFPKNPIFVTGIDNTAYLFIGRDIYALIDGYTQDELRDEGKIEIEARMRLGTLLFPDGGVLTSRRRCIVRDWSITPEIKIYGGGCSISTMGLEMCEV